MCVCGSARITRHTFSFVARVNAIGHSARMNFVRSKFLSNYFSGSVASVAPALADKKYRAFRRIFSRDSFDFGVSIRVTMHYNKYEFCLFVCIYAAHARVCVCYNYIVIKIKNKNSPSLSFSHFILSYTSMTYKASTYMAHLSKIKNVQNRHKTMCDPLMKRPSRLRVVPASKYPLDHTVSTFALIFRFIHVPIPFYVVLSHRDAI